MKLSNKVKSTVGGLALLVSSMTPMAAKADSNDLAYKMNGKVIMLDEPSQQSGANLDAGWRSLLIPGWGQWYNGSKTKAYVFGGVTFGLLASGFVTEGMSENAGREYETAKSDFDTKYGNWENAANLNHTLVTLLGLAYSWQLIDALISKQTGISSKANVKPNGEVELSLYKKF